MLEKIYDAIRAELDDDHEIEYVDGNTNGMIITIDGEPYLIQKR